MIYSYKSHPRHFETGNSQRCGSSGAGNSGVVVRPLYMHQGVIWYQRHILGPVFSSFFLRRLSGESRSTTAALILCLTPFLHEA